MHQFQGKLSRASAVIIVRFSTTNTFSAAASYKLTKNINKEGDFGA